jgi:hypothetical protein
MAVSSAAVSFATSIWGFRLRIPKIRMRIVRIRALDREQISPDSGITVAIGANQFVSLLIAAW